MVFEMIKKLIDDVVGFIKSFAAKLTQFIDGLKTKVEFDPEAAK